MHAPQQWEWTFVAHLDKRVLAAVVDTSGEHVAPARRLGEWVFHHWGPVVVRFTTVMGGPLFEYPIMMYPGSDEMLYLM